MQRPFFVYGTLKRGGSNYARFLAGHTTVEVPATLSGAALYTAGPYPFLVTEPGPVAAGDRVSGVLVRLFPEHYDAVVVAVDGLEGYVEGGADNLYERVLIDVAGSDGTQTAWIYVAGAATLAQIRAGTLRKVVGGIWRAESE